jgi:phosphatidylserine decarboxylase
MEIALFLLLLLASTIMYLYLHKKTRMNLRFLYLDNLVVVAVSYIIALVLFRFLFPSLNDWIRLFISLVIGGLLIIGLGYTFTIIRFWHTPTRKITAALNEIVSPADGNVIYIKKIEAGETPIAIKNGKLNNISELTKSNLLQSPCWLVGINMTPWDVHKNCAPIDGRITLNQHSAGDFLSLKNFDAITMNERNTYVIENTTLRIGVVQIASKGVRRIDSYVKQGSMIKRGDWLGMIRFGSQVDVILPYTCDIKLKLGQQVYAAKTVIASL